MSGIFNTIFYNPLLNALAWLVDILPYHSVGLAIIILTLIVQFILFPFTHRAKKTQLKIKEIEPKLKQIKEKYKKDQQEQAKQIMDLYKEHGINPFSGILLLFIQVPLLFALFRVFSRGLNFDSSLLYSLIPIPEMANLNFLGLIDISQPSYFLAFLAGLSQFVQIRLASPVVAKDLKPTGKSFKDDLARSMSLQARYILPVFIFLIALKFSAALPLYWTAANIFAIVHEVIVRKKAEKISQEK